MIEIQHKNLVGTTFIDLFAGIGGFRLALESLGSKCVYSCEWDKQARKVYLENFHDLPEGDITKIDEYSIPDHDILCAGFPCQAFSKNGRQLGFQDTRGTLFFDVARIVKAKRPKIIFMENVRNFVRHDKGRTLSIVQETIEELGYTFFYQVLNAYDYGIPQNRQRLYMVAFRQDLKIYDYTFPSPFPLQRHVENYLVDEKEAMYLYINPSLIDLWNKEDNVYANRPIRLGSVHQGRQGERIYSVKGTAITLSAYGGGTFNKTGGYFINGQARKLHPRECARLMGFPDTFRFASKPNQAYKQFGNSVVVDVIQIIAQTFPDMTKDQDKP